MTATEATAAVKHIREVLRVVCEGYDIDGFAAVFVLPKVSPGDPVLGVTVGARGPEALVTLWADGPTALGDELAAAISGKPPTARVTPGSRT